MRSPLPVFTLAEFAAASRSDELRRCSTSLGVFYVANGDDLDQDHLAAEDAALRLFSGESDDARASVVVADHHLRRGFAPLDSESTARVTQSGSYSDHATVFSMGRDKNVFPSIAFEAAWRRYYGSLEHVSVCIAQAVLEANGLGQGGLLPYDPVLRFRHYPDVPESRSAEKVPCRMAPHYDLSVVSVVRQGPSPNGFIGLQVELNGEFVDVPPLAGHLVVFCGSVATLVSDGAIVSPRHQVVAPPAARIAGSERTSSVMFMRPSPDFEFSVPLAHSLGMGNKLSGVSASFGEWCGANYLEMHAGAAR